MVEKKSNELPQQPVSEGDVISESKPSPIDMEALPLVRAPVPNEKAKRFG